MTSYDERGSRTAREASVEQVVLLDEAGQAIGSEDKRVAHRTDTRLHLAFSCYVFNSDRELLVTRRALSKATFPGMWTNTVCGHPAPLEDFLDAVRRRSREELGVELQEVRVVLPSFRYRAVMTNGTTENEMCPVAAALTYDQPLVDPAEVAATTWVPWVDLRDGVVDGSRDVSPWCLAQVLQLASLGDDPLAWAATPSSTLPPAAQPA